MGSDYIAVDRSVRESMTMEEKRAMLPKMKDLNNPNFFIAFGFVKYCMQSQDSDEEKAVILKALFEDIKRGY